MAGTRQAESPAAPVQAEMVLAQIESLPTLPSVAARLLELTSSESSSSAPQIVALIESDQSLAARLLAVACRADVGSKATTIRQAVVQLGFGAVRSLVLSMQVFETFASRVEEVTSRLDLRGLWKHSLAVGCAARLLAEALARHAAPATRKSLPKPEEAFVCGLLHDLGKVAMNACFPKSYDRVIVAVYTARGCIADVEQRVFGLDHALAGRRLAMHWKLPTEITECIWLHHHRSELTPKQIQCPTHVRLVQVADRLARQMQIGYSGNYITDELAVHGAATLGIGADALEEVMTELPELIEARAALIGLERLTSKEVYAEAMVHANTELARLNVKLAAANQELKQRSRWFEALSMLTRQSQDASPDEICRTAVEAAGAAAGCWPIVMISLSKTRGIATLVFGDSAENIASQHAPLTALGQLGWLAQIPAGWLAEQLLGPEMRERLSAALGRPVAWCWPIRSPQATLGLLACGGDPRGEPEDCIAILCESTARLLAAAEAKLRADRLAEELSDINRRLAASQAELAQVRSIGMVGEMAAGAAHELNNPLAVISGRAQLLNREGIPEEIRRTAAVLSEHAHRASQIVAELMEFAKPAAPVPARIELRELLGDLRQRCVAKGALGEQAFRLELSDEPAAVYADAAQIAILFDELVNNAIEAMRGISTPLLVVNCRMLSADEEVVISVQDNGCGMSPDVMDRATAPFFSHRPAGRGRGLGLSRAARYAEINGGSIRLSSSPGKGTTVIVTLPAPPSDGPAGP